MTKKVKDKPLGYWCELSPGRVCLYTPQGFAHRRWRGPHERGVVIRGLYSAPQPGGDLVPAVYRGLRWQDAKKYSAAADPGAVALYCGPVIPRK